MYCVYMHINKINNKKYIGLTSQEVNRRWKYGAGYKGSTHFYNAILKYGWDSFKHIIIKDNLLKKEAQILETKLIIKYNTRNEAYGYNLDGGGSAPTHSEETKEKLRTIFKGRKFTEEALSKMRAGFKN